MITVVMPIPAQIANTVSKGMLFIVRDNSHMLPIIKAPEKALGQKREKPSVYFRANPHSHPRIPNNRKTEKFISEILLYFHHVAATN